MPSRVNAEGLTRWRRARASAWRGMRARLATGSMGSISRFTRSPSSGKRRAAGSTCCSSEPTALLKESTLLPRDFPSLPRCSPNTRQPLVQVLAEPADFRGVVGENRLLPAVRDDFQQRDQAGGRRQHHVLPQRIVDQARVLLQCRRQKLIARQEQHDEIRAAFELRPVLLGGQLAHPRADDLRMAAQLRAALLVILSLDRREIGIERRFHVDDDIALIRHVHHHVGTDRAGLGGCDAAVR